MKYFLLAISILFIFSFPTYAQQDYCQNLIQSDCEAASDHGCYWNMYSCAYSTIDAGAINNNQDKISDHLNDLDPMSNKFSTTSDIVNTLLPYLLTGAGLILFAMLISGGFTMMTAVTDPKKAEAGKARITAAIIGFLVVFGAYWITQILEIVLGVKILQ